MNKFVLFKNEFYLNRKTFWIWLFINAGLLAIFAAATDLVLSNAGLLELLESYPQAILDSFNINPESFTTYEGWMASEPYVFLALLLGIFAMLLSATSISREIDGRTGEFLFTTPLSRRTIFFAKAASHLLQLTIVFLASTALVFLLGRAVAEVGNAQGLFLVFLTAYLLSLGCSGIGYLLSCLMDNQRTALSLGVGFVLLSFLFNMLAGLEGFVGRLAKLSSFQLFDVLAILKENALPPLPVAAACLCYLLGLIVSSEILARKNLYL